MRLMLLPVIFLFAATALQAETVADMTPRAGWEVMPTQKSFETLVEDVRLAADGSGLAIVTQAGPTGVAAQRGITIPGNRVFGLFNNDVAVRLLRASTAAMIEAPIRLYVTENMDGSATLSYKLPSVVLAPYTGEDTEIVTNIGAELDALFAGFAAKAVQ